MRYEFFPDRLKQARDAKDWSQTQLGRKMKCATQQISHWELGLRTPNAATIARLATHLGKEPGYFFVQLSDDMQSERGAA